MATSISYKLVSLKSYTLQFSPGSLVSPTNGTDRNDIIGTLLKVTLNNYTSCMYHYPSCEDVPYQGRIQDFKLGGALKNIAPSGGRREIFGVFRVKNHDFTPKNLIFSNFRGGAGCPPPPPPPPHTHTGSAPAYHINMFDVFGPFSVICPFCNSIVISYNQHLLDFVYLNVYFSHDCISMSLTVKYCIFYRFSGSLEITSKLIINVIK